MKTDSVNRAENGTLCDRMPKHNYDQLCQQEARKDTDRVYQT